jgi:hypothetical protein
VEVVERGPQRVVVKATRDWGKVAVTTTYTLRADADRIEMQTTMRNTGDTALTGMTPIPATVFAAEPPKGAQKIDMLPLPNAAPKAK